METIITKMADCEFYACMYAEFLQVTLSTHQTTQSFKQSLDSALPEFYAAVLVFSVKVKGYFASTTAAKITTHLTPFAITFQPYLDKIDEAQCVIRELADKATMQRIKGNSEDLRRMRDFLDDIKMQMTPLEKLDCKCSGYSSSSYSCKI